MAAPRKNRSRRVAVLALSVVLSVAMAQPPLADAQVAAGGTFDVYEASIVALQTAMSGGSVTSVELVDAYLSRIEAFDRAGPGLNAILRLNPGAREEAAALDREREERGARGPLHGIPVIVKDNYDVAGLPTSGGSIALAGHQPLRDAEQVRRLREAGAVILAKSNLHELAYGITTVSSLGGQTRNPYDPARNPGGSSGGTGAAIAASFAAVGWGSDTCGSIRIPAAVNNLFGLRPTKGLSSIDGILPLAHSQDVGGPLARSTEDLAIALTATIGPDPADPATRSVEGRGLPDFMGALQPAALEGARVGVLLPYFGESAEEEETNRLVRAALDEMRRLGAEVVEVPYDPLSELLSGTSVIDLEFKWDLMDYLARTPETPIRSLGEIVAGNLHHRALTNTLRRSDRHESRPPEGYAEALARRELAALEIARLMESEGIDALGYPTLRREAAPIGAPAPGNNCQLSAATGMPAITIPAGFTVAGVPVGIELLGRRFSDAVLLGYAHAFEQAVRPRRPPPTTPALGLDGSSAPVPFTVVASAAGTDPAAPAVSGSFTYHPTMGVLSYMAVVTGLAPQRVTAVVVREAATGPIIHQVAGPGEASGSGSIVLDEELRQSYLDGRLTLQLFIDGSGTQAVAQEAIAPVSGGGGP